MGSGVMFEDDEGLETGWAKTDVGIAVIYHEESIYDLVFVAGVRGGEEFVVEVTEFVFLGPDIVVMRE